jgi:ferritin-like metal-binding protein YciE
MEKKKTDSKEKSSKSKDSKSAKSNDSKASSKKTTPAKKGKLKAADENALKDFLVDELKDIYFAEHEIMKGLTKMKDAATSKKLKKAIDLHYNQTEVQITRLEEAFGLFDEKPSKKKCEAIIGILKEGDDILEDTEEGTMTRDAAIIIASQKVEHYEIATYGSLAELARTIDREDVAEILEATLSEEKETDVSLTILAVDKINEEAAQEPAE